MSTKYSKYYAAALKMGRKSHLRLSHARRHECPGQERLIARRAYLAGAHLFFSETFSETLWC